MTYTTPVLIDFGTIEDLTADKGQGPTDGFQADIPIGDVSGPPPFSGDVMPGQTPGVLPG